jgi:hypothetical protein
MQYHIRRCTVPILSCVTLCRCVSVSRVLMWLTVKSDKCSSCSNGRGRRTPGMLLLLPLSLLLPLLLLLPLSLLLSLSLLLPPCRSL